MKKKLLLALCALLAAASLFAQNVRKTGFPDILLGNWNAVLGSQEKAQPQEYIERIDVRISEFSLLADTYAPYAPVKWVRNGGWKIIDVVTDVPGKQYTAIILTEQGEGDPTPAGYYGKMTLYLDEFPQAIIDEYPEDDLNLYRDEIGDRPYLVLLLWAVTNDEAVGLSKPDGSSPDADLLDVLKNQHKAGFWYAHFYDLEADPLRNDVGKVAANLFKPRAATAYLFVKGNE
jgi:hypothetical protein